LSFTVPSNTLIVPANGQIWAGIGFDNDNGATGITADELNALGGLTFHPATIGTDGSQSFFLAPSSSIGVNNPSVTAFGTPFGANYGWTIDASAVPEPSSVVLV
jgi:hypothetical protein